MPQTLNLLSCLRQNVSNEMIENEEPVLFQADSQDSLLIMRGMNQPQ